MRKPEMRQNSSRHDVLFRVALAVVCTTAVAACGRPTPTFGRVSSAAAGKTPLAPTRNPVVNEVYRETEAPEMAEQDPVEGPVNLPPVPKAPATPVEPGNLQVRAIATTNTFMPAQMLNPVMRTPSTNMMTTTLIRARVTWTPVKGAGAYRIYSLPVREGQAEGDKGKLCYYLPQWAPVAIIGGGLGGLGNLNVGQEYVFTVEALDRAGNVLSAGRDNCAALAPLDLPALREPGPNAAAVGLTPYLKWTPSRGADGYYVEVFKTARATIPTLPMWRGFRADTDANVMMYGQQMDVFEGTQPFQWSLPLTAGQRFAWTVCAVRTDTHNMHNAKAIAKATAPMSYFVP
jgi:hypothetical protein